MKPPTAAASTYPQNWELNAFGYSPLEKEFAANLQTLERDFRSLGSQLKASIVDQSFAKLVANEAFLELYLKSVTLLTDLASAVECYSADDPLSEKVRRAEAEIARLRSEREKVDIQVQAGLSQLTLTDLKTAFEGKSRKDLLPYFSYLKELQNLKLAPELEDLLAEIDLDGIHAWSRLYDNLSGRLKITVMEKGQLVEKSPGQISYDLPERSVRENNFYASEKAWNTIRPSCSAALNHMAGSRLTRYRRAGLTDHLDVPLKLSRLSRETLTSMWSAISKKKSCLVDFLQRKQQILGIDQLRWYDLLAPLPGESSKEKLTYNKACDIIINAFHDFSPGLGDFAKLSLTEKWVEAENRPGKRQGGFCTGLPGKGVSRIFMTYLDTMDSASTLAHELGHAYHTYVMRDLPTVLQDYPMTLAETASTFGEAVMGQRFLEMANTTAQKAQILNHQLQDAVAFLMNIHCRYIFEDNFYKQRVNGELNADELSELMVSAQKEAYVNTLADDGYNPTFWISKLHFYIGSYPFYNFPYTFGYLLSQGLFHVSQTMDNFPERLDKFLYLSGQMTCEQAVQEALGRDITQEEFWLDCIKVIEQRASEFLAIT